MEGDLFQVYSPLAVCEAISSQLPKTHRAMYPMLMRVLSLKRVKRHEQRHLLTLHMDPTNKDWLAKLFFAPSSRNLNTLFLALFVSSGFGPSYGTDSGSGTDEDEFVFGGV